jgi:hypothetical protein
MIVIRFFLEALISGLEPVLLTSRMDIICGAPHIAYVRHKSIRRRVTYKWFDYNHPATSIANLAKKLWLI